MKLKVNFEATQEETGREEAEARKQQTFELIIDVRCDLEYLHAHANNITDKEEYRRAALNFSVMLQELQNRGFDIQQLINQEEHRISQNTPPIIVNL